MNETTELILAQFNKKKVHAETHELGGGDEIDVTKLKNVESLETIDHSAKHELGGSDEIDVMNLRNVDNLVTKTGDFSGTWNGITMTSTEPGLSSAFDALKADVAQRGINVCSAPYNADPTGVTDSTAAIQAAINSLPLNVASPEGFANGGIIYFPKGKYKISQTINLRRGVHLVGQSRESTQLISFTSGSLLKYTDVGSYRQDEIVIENMSLWQSNSVVSTSGAAIELFLGSTGSQSIAVIIRNLLIESFYNGVIIGAGVWSSVDNVDVSHAVENGFYLKLSDGTQSVATTSVTFKNCYANQCKTGYKMEHGVYNSFISCASDSNSEYGYVLDDSYGNSFISCGAEENGIASFYLKNGCKGNLINAYILYETGTTRDGIIVENSTNTTLLAGFIKSYATSGVGVKIVGTSNVIGIGTQFLQNYSTNVTNDYNQFMNMDGLTGIIPDSTTSLRVGGNMNTGVITGFKSTPIFTTVGATRNVSAFFQALVKGDLSLALNLMCGIFIDLPDKGISTVSRYAGTYIRESSAGSTGNANMMVDVGEGTVPSGNWNIYSGSARESVFKGGFRMGGGTGVLWTFGTGSPEGVVTAPIGSMYTRSNGGAVTSLYVKETGSGNTGWVAK